MIVILAPTFSICRILSVHVILMRITLNQSLAYHLPNNWNQIPGEIKEATNLKQFKKKYIKTSFGSVWASITLSIIQFYKHLTCLKFALICMPQWQSTDVWKFFFFVCRKSFSRLIRAFNHVSVLCTLGVTFIRSSQWINFFYGWYFYT